MSQFWQYLASAILKDSKTISATAFKQFFKLPISLTDLIWRKLSARFPGKCSAKHFLWTLHFLKTLNPLKEETAKLLHTNKITLKIHVVKTLLKLLIVLPKFNFSSRFEKWNYRSPSCLVDTTYVRIRQPYLDQWEYWNNHKKDYTLNYQVVVSLGKPYRILAFDGPYKGSAADVSIFRLSPIYRELKSGEKVMTDRGYYQETERCWFPPIGNMNTLSVEEKVERRKVTRIRQLNERVIGRLTFWGVFKRRWNYGFDFHELCAHVAARITNLELSVAPLT
jgi:hypothetical protein